MPWSQHCHIFCPPSQAGKLQESVNSKNTNHAVQLHPLFPKYLRISQSLFNFIFSICMFVFVVLWIKPLGVHTLDKYSTYCATSPAPDFSVKYFLFLLMLPKSLRANVIGLRGDRLGIGLWGSWIMSRCHNIFLVGKCCVLKIKTIWDFLRKKS